MHGKVPLKRNRFVSLTGGHKRLNTDLEAKARAPAGWKAYVTNRLDVGPEFVIEVYHRIERIEQSFRMSKSDLRARPIYDRKRNSIEARLTAVFAALAITRYIENATGWTIKKFVQTARRYQTVISASRRAPRPGRPRSARGPAHRARPHHLTDRSGRAH